MLTKNGGGDHKRRLSRVHYICTMHCVQCTLEKQCTAHHVIIWNKKEMSQLDAMLTRVHLTLTLTFDLEFSRSNCISGKGGPIDMERKGESIRCPDMKHDGNESTGCCAEWGTFDLEFSRSNCILGMGGTIVMERKGWESIGCPDVKH